MTLIERIDLYCKENNIRPRQLELLSGMTPGIISKWRNGRPNPSADNLIKLSNFTHISIDVLLEDELNKADMYDPMSVGEGIPDYALPEPMQSKPFDIVLRANPGDGSSDEEQVLHLRTGDTVSLSMDVPNGPSNKIRVTITGRADNIVTDK